LQRTSGKKKEINARERAGKSGELEFVGEKYQKGEAFPSNQSYWEGG